MAQHGWERLSRLHTIGFCSSLTWLVQASSHLASCLAKASLFALVFLMVLLFWDLYTCPQTLAIASACLRSTASCPGLGVFVLVYKLSFHSQAVELLTMEGKNRHKQWTVKMLSKRSVVMASMVCIDGAPLNGFGIVYQVSRSIPGFPASWEDLVVSPENLHWDYSRGRRQVQSCLILASRVTSEKFLFTTASNLIMNFLIPSLIIVYLDTGCLGRWVALWKPCRK